MRRINPFVYGHVGGAFVVGLVGGAFLDLTAVIAFSSSLAVAAAISALICRWWPTFDAAGWKLWLVATLANPLMLAGLVWSLVKFDCIIGERKGWDCLFSDVGWVAAAATLPSSIVGLMVLWLWRRARPRSPSPAGP